MTLTTRIALLSFAGLAAFVGIDPVQAEWIGGPVLIGGDDTDHHFIDETTGEPLGRPYIREGFGFLGALVTNGNTLAVCVGCNPANGGQK